MLAQTRSHTPLLFRRLRQIQIACPWRTPIALLPTIATSALLRSIGLTGTILLHQLAQRFAPLLRTGVAQTLYPLTHLSDRFFSLVRWQRLDPAHNALSKFFWNLGIATAPRARTALLPVAALGLPVLRLVTEPLLVSALVSIDPALLLLLVVSGDVLFDKRALVLVEDTPRLVDNAIGRRE